MSNKNVLVAGSLVLDIVAAVAEGADQTMLFAQGKQTELSCVTMYLGGEVGNMGVALHKLGIPVRLVSKVGDDTNGGIIRRLLDALAVPTRITTVEGMPSTASICLTIPGRDKITFHQKGASQTFTAADFTPEELRRTDLFHFGYPPTMKSLYEKEGGQLYRMLRQAKEAGATTALDMSLPSLASAAGQVDWKPILQKILPLVDIFLPSLEECIFLCDRTRYLALSNRAGSGNMIDLLDEAEARSLAGLLLEMGAKVVLLKCGKKGMYLRTARDLGGMGRAAPEDPACWRQRELWDTPCDVKQIRSTTGAGDTAIAGFLAAFLNGYDPGRALQIASYTAARCIEGYDTSGALGSLQEAVQNAGRYGKLDGIIAPGYWQPGSFPGQWVGEQDAGRT